MRQLRYDMCFVGIMVLVCVLFSGGTAAAAPVLNNLVIEPSILEEGSGLQIITITVQASDPDADLKKVKMV